MNNSARLLILGVVLVLTGCGGGGTTPTQAQQETTPTTRASDLASLQAAVRRALAENSALSLYTLWHDELPSWAQHSTRGPALAELRTSAVQRRRQGIHIKHLSGQLEIVSVRLDPSYTRASAVVRAHDRVRPYRAGKPIGRAIDSNEHARIELHRLGQAARFVVWKVVLLS
jgi:esterase/lipase superfamily enzyme